MADLGGRSERRGDEADGDDDDRVEGEKRMERIDCHSFCSG